VQYYCKKIILKSGNKQILCCLFGEFVVELLCIIMSKKLFGEMSYG
jgi:hypothetical protein